MKTTKYALAAALVLVGLSPPAHADPITYVINFTVTSGSPITPSGMFTFDSANPRFSNFLVTWDGFTFDLTASANAPLALTGVCTGEAATPTYGFAIMSHSLVGCTPSYTWTGVSNQTPSQASFSFVAQTGFQRADLISTSIPVNSTAFVTTSGSWSITPVPEPSSLLLISTGLLGVLGAARRKWLA